MKNNHSPKRIRQAILVLAAAAAFGFFVFNHRDVLEKMVSWSRQYEDLQIDEIVATSALMLIVTVILLVRRWRDALGRQRMLALKNDQLQKSMDEIKHLRGLLPLCSYCKKVRNDEGFWSGKFDNRST